MSLNPERTPAVYPVFLWLEISGHLELVGDGTLAEAIRQTMSGRRLGDDVLFTLTDDERARVQAALADEAVWWFWSSGDVGSAFLLRALLREG